MYPPDWPRCPVCDEPALDGHITCGSVGCDEGGQRNERGHLIVQSWPKPRVSNPNFLSEELASFEAQKKPH